MSFRIKLQPTFALPNAGEIDIGSRLTNNNSKPSQILDRCSSRFENGLFLVGIVHITPSSLQ